MATWPTVTDDDGSGTTGTILDQALFNSIRDYIGTAWTNVTFSAGNFTTNATSAWTVSSGDQAYFKYLEIGKTMFVSLRLDATSVSVGDATELHVTVPNGRTIGGSGQGHLFNVWATDNGTQRNAAYGHALSGDTYVRFVNGAGTNWATSTNNTVIWANFFFEIQ